MTGTARRDGCAIAWRADGDAGAPALLLSHSLGATLDMWSPQLAAFSARFRVIRYDTRGHGRSDVPPGEYTLEQLGRDALAVLDAAGARAAHVCGLSLGGITAMWLGVHAPDRVRSLTLASTAARIGSRESWSERIAQVRSGGVASIADAVIARWFGEPFRAEQPAVVARFHAMLAACPADGYAGCSAALRDADLRGEIPRIAVPTLVVSGRDDPATPPSDGEDVRARIPGARMAVLDAKHLANVEQADAFTRVVLEFLEDAGRPGQSGRSDQGASHG